MQKHKEKKKILYLKQLHGERMEMIPLWVWWPNLFNPLYLNISMHILHTVLNTFLKVLKRRICLTVKSSLVVDHFPYSHDLNVWIQGDIVERNYVLVSLRGLRVNMVCAALNQYCKGHPKVGSNKVIGNLINCKSGG